MPKTDTLTPEAPEIARLVTQIQRKLRQDLLDDLLENEEDLENLFDAGAYSLALDEYRSKYLDKLHVLQSLLSEIANLDEGHRRRRILVASVAAPTHEQLTKHLNKKLTEITGAHVQDVKFTHTHEEGWVAFINYSPSPFPRKRPK